MTTPATETLAFAVTFVNGIYKLDFTDATNPVVEIPRDQAVLKTHPSDGTLYYFGTNGNIVTLNYTLCTNLSIVSRELQLDAVVALATGAPLGSVTISGQPILVTPTSILTRVYSVSGNRSSSGVLYIMRPGAGSTVRLLALSANTATALSAGTNTYIRSGATITGGAWAVDAANIPGSNMEFNTGGTVGGTPAFQIVLNFATQLVLDLSPYNIQYTALQPLVLYISQSGLGATSAALTWTETP